MLVAGRAGVLALHPSQQRRKLPGEILGGGEGEALLFMSASLEDTCVVRGTGRDALHLCPLFVCNGGVDSADLFFLSYDPFSLSVFEPWRLCLMAKAVIVPPEKPLQ